jgi:hypothetical protein
MEKATEVTTPQELIKSTVSAIEARELLVLEKKH